MSTSKLTPADDETVAVYLAAESKALGSLHERMKWLIGCKEELREHIESSADDRLKVLFGTLAIAVMDLETEVSYIRPAKPPFATRTRDSLSPRVYPHYEHKKNV